MEAQGEWDCVIDMIGYTPEDAESAIRAFSGRTEQFVFCSTVDTFKKPAPSYPIRQDTPRGADKRFTYAWNKVKMEERFEEAAAEGAFALTIVRPAATYNDESMPIGILDSGVAIMRRMRQGLPVIVMGDGLSLWCSAHRDDVGRAIAMAAGNSRAFGKAYTLSGDEAITWIQYYGAVAEALGVPTVEFVGVPTALLAAAAPRECEWCYVNFKYDNVFDNGLAKRDLGFRYTIPWSEGARRMVNHHDSLGAIDGSKDHPNYDRIIESIRRLETEFRKYPYLSAMEDLT
jgi:nucleoside-diphosphate-sugar epimerase